MSISVNPSFAHCSRKDCFVSTEQTEGKCRERHNCGDEACPLEKEFGQDRFRRALETLSASIGQGFAGALK